MRRDYPLPPQFPSKEDPGSSQNRRQEGRLPLLHSGSARNRRKEGRPLIHPVHADFEAGGAGPLEIDARWGRPVLHLCSCRFRRRERPSPPPSLPWAIPLTTVIRLDFKAGMGPSPLPLVFNTRILLYPCLFTRFCHPYR